MESKFDLTGLSPMDAKMGPFHQITAITQGSINFQLKQQWAMSDDLQKLNIALPPSGRKKIVKGRLKADMDPMQVQLGIGTNNRRVWCYLNLKNGEMMYWDDGEEIIKFGKWRIAFQVDMDLQSEKMKDLPKFILDRLGQAGNYSVKKLLLDFTTADIASYSETFSSLPETVIKDDAVTTAEIQTSLGNLLKIYINVLKQKQDEGDPRSIIGYSVNFDEPEKAAPHAPTLVPTSMVHQNTPYFATGAQQPITDLFGPDKDIADNNMLLYLEMTDHEPMPANALNTFSNWVVPRTGGKLMDGSVSIARDRFFKKYLLPKLDIINRNTSVDAKRASHDGFNLTEITFHFELGKSFDDDALPSDYAWKETNDPLQWTFERTTGKDSGNPATIMQIYGALSCTVKNRLKVVPETNEIQLTGTITVDKTRNANFLNGASYTFKTNWSLTIKLDSVENGQLGAVTTQTGPTSETPHITRQNAFVLDDNKHAEQLKSLVTDGLKFADTVDSLCKILGGSWDFYFAGTGVFVLKNPLFNKEGDLMCELQYVEGGDL